MILTAKYLQNVSRVWIGVSRTSQLQDLRLYVERPSPGETREDHTGRIEGIPLSVFLNREEITPFYFAEEVLSTYEYKRLIKADDRATMLNLMVGLGGYTLCSGIICEDLNGSDYCAVKLDSDEIMTIGYIARKGVNISALGKKYLEEISRYKDKALK